jgi:hypothetical protein
MIWDTAKPEQIFNVAKNMREKDFEEIVCLTYCDDREELAGFLTEMWSKSETTLACGTKEDGPIAIFTYTPVRPNVWSFGMFATDKFGKIGTQLTRLIIKRIITAIDSTGAHRVECQSIEGYDEVHKWLQFLGLKKEGLIKGFGRNGENFIGFAYVKDSDKPVRWSGPGRIENVFR